MIDKIDKMKTSSNDFTQAVLDSIPANIAVMDENSNIIAVNKAWENFADKSKDSQDSCIGVNYLNVCKEAQKSGEDVSEIITGLNKVLQGEKDLFVYEYPCPLPGGDKLWFSMRAAPLLSSSSDSIQGAVVFHFDITDRKKAEKSLEKSEERFRSFVENAHDIIFTVKSTGIFTYMSPNCKNILGYSANEIIGKNFMRFVHPDDIEMLAGKLSEKAKEHQGKRAKLLHNESVEYRAIHKLGDYKWLSAKTSLLQYDSDNFEIMGIARDITEHKQMEDELNQYYEELEYLYEELDKEINKAKEIHEKTLPKSFPDIEKVSLSAFYNPAETIGGDFYDVITSGNKLIMYLSDVTGHGLDSAMMSAFIKNTINTYVALKDSDIRADKLVEFLAKQFIEEGYPGDFFICVELAILDIDTNELEYNGIGIHEPPLMKSGDNNITELKSSSLPISTAIPWDSYNFSSEKIRLNPGDTILFTTDGLAEHRLGDQKYRDRLSKTFHEFSHLPPEVIVETIKNDFATFNNGSLQGDDDITFMVFQLEEGNKRTYSYEIESDFEDMDWLIKELTPKLPQSEKSQQLLIAIHELTANAIEHGNHFHPDKQVKVDLTIADGKYITASIEDQGEGFNWKKGRKEPSIKLNSEEDRGRGISISQVVCDNIYYNYKGNKVYIIINL